MRKYVSFIIVLSITAFVSFAATVIVTSSVQDSESNLRVTEKFLAQVSTPARADESTEMPIATMQPAVLGDALTQAVHDAQCQQATPSAGPIGKYLKNKGLPTTREYREKLASDYNIASYSGTMQQNTVLLQRILEKERKDLGCE